MRIAIVQEQQSLFDIAIQYCGGIEAVFTVAELNALSITEALVPGTELKLPLPFNDSVFTYYTKNELQPATDAPSTGSGGSIDDLLDDGIDFMAIQVDNVVT